MRKLRATFSIPCNGGSPTRVGRGKHRWRQGDWGRRRSDSGRRRWRWSPDRWRGHLPPSSSPSLPELAVLEIYSLRPKSFARLGWWHANQDNSKITILPL
jgi:hypothetical protein